VRYSTWIAISAALAAGCSDKPTPLIKQYQVGEQRFRVPANSVLHPTRDSLAIYMRVSDFELLDRDADDDRLFVQIQDGRQPNITAAIALIKRYGGVVGDDVHGGLTPMVGGGGDGIYFNQHRYGGAYIFCAPQSFGCRARVPYGNLSISIRFARPLLASWARLIDGVLRKVEMIEVQGSAVEKAAPNA
jgi:hypothetical protein